MSNRFTWQCRCRERIEVMANDFEQSRDQAERVGWLFVEVKGHPTPCCSIKCARDQMQHGGSLLPAMQTAILGERDG